MKKKLVIFVATTPFAVNAFLRQHMIALTEFYDIILCVNTELYPLVEELKLIVRVHHVNLERKISPFDDLIAIFQLVRIFRFENPTVVHSITPKAGLLAMVAARLARVPWRIHTFTGQVWANRDGISRYLLKNIDRLIVYFSSCVFADSESQCRFLENEEIVPPNGIGVIGPGSIAGVNLNTFKPDPLSRSLLREGIGSSTENLIFIYVGRLVRDKGISDLIEAFVLASADHYNWELWIVGPDEDGLKTDLKARFENLEARIRWFDPTVTPELYMNAADVFVLPSYREGFGSVIIEAAACGVPSIAYKIDGVIDAIVENYTGLLVKKGDINALANAMVQLGDNTCLRKKLGKLARDRVVSNFSDLTITHEWKKLYNKIFGDS